MDTKVNFPFSISGVYAPVQVAQWNDMVGKMFTPYLAQTDSVMHLDLPFRTKFAQLTFSLLVGTLSNFCGAMVIRLAFILLKHCEKSVLVQSVLHYGIRMKSPDNRPNFKLAIGQE
jgi:hypothetical protein